MSGFKDLQRLEAAQALVLKNGELAMSQLNANAVHSKSDLERRYRAFVLTFSGEIEGIFHVAAADDDEAAAVAQAMAIVSPIELWDGLRFIERYEATRPLDVSPS